MDEDKNRLISEYMANAGTRPNLAEAMVGAMAIKWSPAPGFKCPTCGGETLERSHGLLMASPWSGAVHCTACEYRDSVCNYLAKTMLTVEPLPDK